MSTLIPKKADKSFHVKRQGDNPAVEKTATREAAQPPVVNSKQRPKGCEAAAGSWFLPKMGWGKEGGYKWRKEKREVKEKYVNTCRYENEKLEWILGFGSRF